MQSQKPRYKKKYYKKQYKKPSKKYAKSTMYRGNVTLSYPLPPQMRTKLAFTQAGELKSSLTAYNAKCFRPTSYYDADPAVGGGTYAGYNFYSAEYSRYRVTSFKYIIRFCNVESFPVRVSVQPIAATSTPPEGTTDDYTEYADENKYCHVRLLGSVNATPEATLVDYVRAQDIWGTVEVKTDASWASLTGSSPAANTYIRIAATRIDGNNMVYGVQYTVKFIAYGEWHQVNPGINS